MYWARRISEMLRFSCNSFYSADKHRNPEIFWNTPYIAGGALNVFKEVFLVHAKFLQNDKTLCKIIFYESTVFS